MAKQPKKSPAKTAAKKPAAAKKVAAPVVPKPVAKKATAKKTAAKKAAAKAPAAKGAAKKTAPKTAAKKPTAKTTTKTAARAAAGPLLLDAAPTITSPSAGSVTPSTDLTVTITTNRTDFAYVVTLTDITSVKPVVVQTNNIPAPGASPFQTTIPSAKLPSAKTFKLKVKVDPADGSTPPNLADEITITT